jgi:hypothetical protein
MLVHTTPRPHTRAPTHHPPLLMLSQLMLGSHEQCHTYTTVSSSDISGELDAEARTLPGIHECQALQLALPTLSPKLGALCRNLQV